MLDFLASGQMNRQADFFAKALKGGKKYVKTNSRAPVLHPYFGGNHRVDQSHYALVQ